MDRFLSSGQLAGRVGISVPRLHRAVGAGVVAPTARAGRALRFPPEAAQKLARHLGAVPARAEGLTREDMLVLAALSRRPRGIRSARGVATVSGISPTTASASLARLERAGLVDRDERVVAEGEAKPARYWRAAAGSPAYQAVVPLVRTVELPARTPTRRHVRTVPSRFAHLFWNEDTSRLRIDRDGVFVAKRILSSDDPEAHAWLASGALRPDDIEAAAAGRGVSARRAALGRVIAGALR